MSTKDYTNAGEYYEAARRWEKHRKYQDWQAAKEMNLLFGEGYVRVPEIPSGYNEVAQRWWENKTH